MTTGQCCGLTKQKTNPRAHSLNVQGLLLSIFDLFSRLLSKACCLNCPAESHGTRHPTKIENATQKLWDPVYFWQQSLFLNDTINT